MSSSATGRPSDTAGRWARVLETLPEGLLLLDEQLTVLAHNGVAHRVLGLDPSDDLNRYVHPDDLALLLAAEAEVRTRPPGWNPPVPVRLRHPDGQWHTWALSVDNRLDDPDVRAVVLQAREVGSGQVGTMAIDVLLRELAAAAPVALVTLDRSGRVRYATGAGLTVEPERLIGSYLVDLVEDEPQEAAVWRALAGEHVDEVMPWHGRWWQFTYTPLIRDGAVQSVVGVFLDVTERKEAESALAASEAHLRGVLQAVREALVVVDEKGRITSSNAPFRQLFGVNARPGTALTDAVDPATADALRSLLERLPSAEPDRCELRVRGRGGTPVWLLASASRLRADDGAYVGSVIVLTDITAQKDAERRLAAVARTDPVTGAHSRSTLADRLDQALARREGLVAVLFCDVDGLKAVNDRYGHVAGDALLRVVSERIRSALRPADTLARYGGDEFVVVCDGLPGPDEAVNVADRIVRAVAVPFRLDDARVLHPSVSVGVSTSPPRHGPAELLAGADAAVYAAKKAGRSTVRLDA